MSIDSSSRSSDGNPIDYRAAPVPVRADLVRAHARAWDRIAHAGTWWDGADRVAIAAETRQAMACGRCARAREALSPQAARGTHDGLDDLPPAAVDAVHRIRTDPGRLSESWQQALLGHDFTDAHYVELVAVTATVVAVDTFHHGLGLDAPPLPAPAHGEPTRYRPASACPDGAWVPQIPRGAATGNEHDLYPEGFVPNVRRALSLVPDEVRGFFDLLEAQYLPIEDVAKVERNRRAISRAQIELIAARVSALNQCFY